MFGAARKLRVTKRLGLLAAAAAVMLSAACATANAAGDTDDSLSPPSTAYAISSTGSVTFSFTIDGISVTVTCTSMKLTAKTRASGLTADVTSNPVLSGCTANIGGTLTVTASGTWTLTVLDNASEGATEPNTGDQVRFNIPAGGLTFVFSAFASCKVSVGASLTSTSFNDQNTITFNNAPVNVTGSGCTVASPAHFTGTFTTGTNVGDYIT